MYLLSQTGKNKKDTDFLFDSCTTDDSIINVKCYFQDNKPPRTHKSNHKNNCFLRDLTSKSEAENSLLYRLDRSVNEIRACTYVVL